MKVLVVSPVPTYATWDVFEGHIQGLRANGVEVERMNYSKIWNMYADFKEFMEITGRVDFNTINHTLLAGDRIVSAAISLGVDLVHFVAPMHINPVTLRVLKQAAQIKTSAYFTECPYDDEHTLKMAKFFDFCFVCDKTSVTAFREHNRNTYYIGHAYNPERHQLNGNTNLTADVVFVGTNFPSRVTFLQAMDWENIDLHLHGLMPIKNDTILGKFVKGEIPIPNDVALDLYREARIGLQMHRRDGYDPRSSKRVVKGGLIGATPLSNFVAYSIGPRSYELAACGVFQVCDEGREELREVFGDTVPTYRTPGDLSALLRTYLDDPVRREEQAKAQHEAVEPYTFEARMRTMLEALG